MSELIGKHLLIGITFLDDNDQIVDLYQTHGIITAMNNEQGIVINKADGTGAFSIPYGIEYLEVALPGEYTIKSTREIVVNPDLISIWSVYATEGNTIENFKR